MDLKKYIADVPDFPKPGILFRDITPLLQHPSAFRHALNLIKESIAGREIDAFRSDRRSGFPDRGATGLGNGQAAAAGQERGEAAKGDGEGELRPGVWVQFNGIASRCGFGGRQGAGSRRSVGDRGTAEATVRLVEELGGVVAGLAFLVELKDLGGRDRIKGYPITTVIEY